MQHILNSILPTLGLGAMVFWIMFIIMFMFTIIIYLIAHRLDNSFKFAIVSPIPLAREGRFWFIRSLIKIIVMLFMFGAILMAFKATPNAVLTVVFAVGLAVYLSQFALTQILPQHVDETTLKNYWQAHFWIYKLFKWFVIIGSLAVWVLIVV